MICLFLFTDFFPPSLWKQHFNAESVMSINLSVTLWCTVTFLLDYKATSGLIITWLPHDEDAIFFFSKSAKLTFKQMSHCSWTYEPSVSCTYTLKTTELIIHETYEPYTTCSWAEPLIKMTCLKISALPDHVFYLNVNKNKSRDKI